MKAEPLFKLYETIWFCETEFTGFDEEEPRLTKGRIISEPVWRDNPSDQSDDTPYIIVGWTGPPGWLYEVEFRDSNVNFIAGGIYHELELIKCCSKAI